MMFNLLISMVAAFVIGSSNIQNNNMEINSQMDQKTLAVKELEFSSLQPDAAQIEDAFNKKDVGYTPVNCANWPQYNGNYAPDVKFRIGYSKDEIYIQYVVVEDDIKASYGTDAGSKPYTDSCVEFFVIPGEGGEYYNLELNCIGKGTFAGGKERVNRTRYGDDVLSLIRRESSLEPVAFGTRTKADNGNMPYTWKLTVAIPLKVFSLSEVKPLKGRSLKANFYKCGDDMPQKHYLSWNPINIEKPNFHRPDHFGTLVFE